MASNEADKYGRLLRVPTFAWDYANRVGARRGMSASAVLQQFIRQAIEANEGQRKNQHRR